MPQFWKDNFFSQVVTSEYSYKYFCQILANKVKSCRTNISRLFSMKVCAYLRFFLKKSIRFSQVIRSSFTKIYQKQVTLCKQFIFVWAWQLTSHVGNKRLIDPLLIYHMHSPSCAFCWIFNSNIRFQHDYSDTLFELSDFVKMLPRVFHV